MQGLQRQTGCPHTDPSCSSSWRWVSQLKYTEVLRFKLGNTQMTLDQVLALILQYSFCFCLRQWCQGMDIDGCSANTWQSILINLDGMIRSPLRVALFHIWSIWSKSAVVGRQCHEGSTVTVMKSYLILSVRIKGHEASIINEGASFEWCESVGYWISTRSYTTRRRTLLFVLQHRWATLPQRFPTLSPLQKNLSQVLPCSESLGRTHIVLHVTLRFSM